MAEDVTPEDVARELRVGMGLVKRRLREMRGAGELSLPETSVLARLEAGEPATSAALAKREGISPQSMGATLAALEARGCIERRPDPSDGRQSVLTITESGRASLRSDRERRNEHLARAIAAAFTADERRALMTLAPLLERLAHQL